MAGTILRMGWTDPRTDVFGAHPLLGPIFDLNDGVTFTLLDDTLELEPPTRELALAGNPRTQGERATRALYRHNRQARAQLCLGPMASYSDLVANVRALAHWLDAAPATPFCVQWQPPSATQPLYLDVVGAAHGIPADEREWLRLQLEPVEIVLLVRPGLRGDRVTLSNLVVNPGFEAPSGPGVNVFSDSFANANAYSVKAGGAPSVASNVMTIPSGGQVAFGSPAWGAINQWQVRWQATSGTQAAFYLHYTDGSNNLFWQCFYGGVGSTSALVQQVGGVAHVLASSTLSFTAGNWYWLVATQFPCAPGSQCDVQVTIYTDSAGALGTVLGTFGPVATYDGVTALAGQPRMQAINASLPVGGNFSNVHTVSLFGPGGHLFVGSGGTGRASGAWEQNPANTFGGGAVTSFGAARIDCAPAGTTLALWQLYAGGGTPAATPAINVGTGQTLGLAAWARSSGLGSSATIALFVEEYDINGSPLRGTTIQSVTGNHAAWTQLSGTLTAGAATVWADVQVVVTDATSGSANATVWLENMQCWNQTATGQTSMPYCELRFMQSPAQLLVTGLLGDLPAPALLAWGTYLTSWPTGATLAYALGRRGQGQAASVYGSAAQGANGGSAANTRLVGASHGYYGNALSPTSTAALDATSYGGYYVSALVNPGWNPRAFSFAPADGLGVYHLISRFLSGQASGNLANVQTRVATQQKQNAWFGTLGDADQLGEYYGPYGAPLSASNTWTPCDSGQVNVPALPAGALSDLSENYLTPRPQWEDLTGGGSTCHANWQLLLPVDGSLLLGVVNNPSNGAFGVTNAWLWGYHDGLALNRSAIGDVAAATWSQEVSALPNPGHAGGGPGTQTTGAVNINSAADAALILDPTLGVAATAPAGASVTTAAGGSGVNQLAGYVADGAGTVLALHCELQYSPLYLYPR